MEHLRNIFGGGDQPQESGSPLTGMRQQLEGQVNQVIDRVSGMIPGVDQYATQCKQAISGALQSFQTNVERVAGDKLSGLNLGGMMGGSQQTPPPPPSS
ncbi:MAG: hypothetical protein J2P37_10065 [Ktedonobacteraceae bacterium]|nr:hypothetical protein [Ktedonobacteraceae bacterium]